MVGPVAIVAGLLVVGCGLALLRDRFESRWPALTRSAVSHGEPISKRQATLGLVSLIILFGAALLAYFAHGLHGFALSMDSCAYEDCDTPRLKEQEIAAYCGLIPASVAVGAAFTNHASVCRWSILATVGVWLAWILIILAPAVATWSH
jgi:hypothetical protein